MTRIRADGSTARPIATNGANEAIALPVDAGKGMTQELFDKINRTFLPANIRQMLAHINLDTSKPLQAITEFNDDQIYYRKKQ